MEGTTNSGKSDPPDSPLLPLIDGNVFRSSTAIYHPPNPPTSPLVSSSQSPMDIDTPLPPSDQTLKTLDRISSLELALVRTLFSSHQKQQELFLLSSDHNILIILSLSVFEFHLLQYQAT
jgi:hypothetical protein